MTVWKQDMVRAMNWLDTIERWRNLPPQEKARSRWEGIPDRVARSMAFEGEPVSLQALRETFAQSEPPALLKPPAAPFGKTQLAPLLAERVMIVQADIERPTYAQYPLDESLLLEGRFLAIHPFQDFN